MEKKFRLEMDTVFSGKEDHDPKFEGTSTLLHFCEDNNIFLEVIDWHGPGGGWPIIEFTGTEDALRKLLRDNDGFGCELEDVEFHMKEAIEIPETVKIKYMFNNDRLPEEANEVLKQLDGVDHVSATLEGKYGIDLHLSLEITVSADYGLQRAFDLGSMVQILEAKYFNDIKK